MEGLSVAASVFGTIQLTGSLVKICGGYIQEMKNAREDIMALQRSIVCLEGTVQNLFELLQGPHATKLSTSSLMTTNINDCFADLGALEKKINPKEGKGMMRKLGIRALKWPLKRTEVDGIIERLDRYKSSFIFSLQIDQTALLADVAQSTDILIDQSLSLEKLPITSGAEFDSYMDQHEETCLPGTRTELLHQITEWVVSPQGKCIFWLNGMAGSGKSTISRTVARSSKEAKILGATFFFKRGEGNRGRAVNFFSTIARQFAINFPELVPGIKKAINDDPDIAAKSLKEQFEKLLYQPLLSLKHSPGSLGTGKSPIAVIVIDALDECEVDTDIRTILQLLPQLRGLSVHVRIFLTSRPDLPIQLGFLEIKNQHYEELVLHNILEASTAHDIALFLNWRLSKIRKQRSLSVSWPTETDEQALVALSAPLFIFAATICRVLEDPQWDPEESLTEILTHRGDIPQLDRTYLPVLDRVLHNQSEKQKKQLIREFRGILGVIIMLESPLPICSLTTLTGFSENLINRRLNALHSVIRVPETREIPLRLFHLSFRDFLLDPESRNKTPLWIDEKHVHQKLATRCLAICYTLKRDLCELADDVNLRSDIDPQTIRNCLTLEMQYSCRFWAQHLIQSQDPSLLRDAFLFLQKHFLHWIEAMSILGLASEIVRIVDLLHTVALGRDNPDDIEVLSFFHDAKRFVLKNRQIANIAPLQIYCSGIVFAPKKSIIRQNFQAELPKCIKRLPDVEDSWNAELQALEGHLEPVFSVAFSPDGRIIASGSADNTIRLWDPLTGKLQHTLEGHSDWVRSVAFSPENQLLASASSDSTLRLWDSAIGTLKKTLEGHTGPVWSVAFSANNRLLASGSFDQTICLWDPVNGALLRKLDNPSSVWSVAFSPDSQVLVSACRDTTIGLWDPYTGMLQRKLEGHFGSVWSVTFSPDGRFLASGSSDQTIRIWDSTTGNLKHKLEGHQECVRSLSFSYDGRILASSDNTHIIRLWDFATGTSLQELIGHSNSVWSLAFSPKSQILASCSYDQTLRLWDFTSRMNDVQQAPKSHSSKVKSVVFSPNSQLLVSSTSDSTTIRLWDPVTGDLYLNLEGHSAPVLSVVFSPDGQLLASSSIDQTIQIWDSATGNPRQTLKGHSDWPLSIAFSPNGQKIASSSHDQTIRLWDTTTGAIIHTLEGHADSIYCVTFSPDDRLLASGSYDCTVRVWDAATGTLQHTLNGHTNLIRSVSFSPDGQLLASGSSDYTIRVWDNTTGTLQHALEGHSQAVCSVTFSHDSRKLASGSYDHTVRIWDLTAGEMLQQVLRSDGIVTDLKYSGNSRLDTNLGCLIIRSPDDNSEPHNQTDPEIFIREHQWITMNGKKVLWLPHEFRPTCSAIRGNTLALGHASGVISFIEFGAD